MLSYRLITMQNRGLIPNYEASATKLYSMELNQRIANTGLKLLGHVRPARRRQEQVGAAGRPAAVHVPALRRQHHRGRHHGDPEEHRRDAGAGPAAQRLSRAALRRSRRIRRGGWRRAGWGCRGAIRGRVPRPAPVGRTSPTGPTPVGRSKQAPLRLTRMGGFPRYPNPHLHVRMPAYAPTVGR